MNNKKNSSLYETQIRDNINQISVLKNDIDELTQIKGRMEKLKKAVEDAGNNINLKVSLIPKHFRYAIKMNIFSQLIEGAKGWEYHSAISGLDEGLRKIQKKIDECNSQIGQLKIKNQECTIKIAELNRVEQEE